MCQLVVVHIVVPAEQSFTFPPPLIPIVLPEPPAPPLVIPAKLYPDLLPAQPLILPSTTLFVPPVADPLQVDERYIPAVAQIVAFGSDRHEPVPAPAMS